MQGIFGACKGIDRFFVFTLKPNKLINAIRIRPVGFYSNCGKPLFRNQTLGNLRAEAIELVGSMRSFSDQNQPRVTNHFKQRIKIRRFSRQRMSRLADRVDKIVFLFSNHSDTSVLVNALQIWTASQFQ
jgi:hypothetical protein